MSAPGRQRERLLAWADTFLPDESERTLTFEEVRRVRVAVAQSALGVAFTLGMSALYASLGSPWSALALGGVALGLALAPGLLRRGASVVAVGNLMIALAFASTLVVALRSGGPASPALVFHFLLPLAIYAVAGRASAMAWTGLAALQVGGLHAAAAAGSTFAQDIAPDALITLRIIADAGVLAATLALLFVVDGARAAAVEAQRAAELALDRQRILDDMHDGVGSHLLGLLVQSRAGALRSEDLVTGLETCLDDLRLIVDSLDPERASLESALAALRARAFARCEGLGITLRWSVEPELLTHFTPAAGMQVLRALQELIHNALRHAKPTEVEVRVATLSAAAAGSRTIEIAVLDDGVGLPLEDGTLTPESLTRRPGRGTKSLRTRARKLGGALVVTSRSPGLRVGIELPLPPRAP